MIHRHRISKNEKTVGWTHCVTPAECAARPERQTAHGNIVYIATCSCGAVRHSEVNGGRVNYGPWIRPEEEGK